MSTFFFRLRCGFLDKGYRRCGGGIIYLENDEGDLTSFASRLSCLIFSAFASSYSSASDSNCVNLALDLAGRGVGGARVTIESSSLLSNRSTLSPYGCLHFDFLGPNPNDDLIKTNGKIMRLIKIDNGLTMR